MRTMNEFNCVSYNIRCYQILLIDKNCEGVTSLLEADKHKLKVGTQHMEMIQQCTSSYRQTMYHGDAPRDPLDRVYSEESPLNSHPDNSFEESSLREAINPKKSQNCGLFPYLP